MSRIWRGFFFGFIFFFAGYYAFFYKAPIFHYANYFANLPVITKLSQQFKTGIALAGQDFFTRQQQDFQHKNISEALNRNDDWVWQRTSIEAKLQQHFGARQAEKRSYFLNYIEQHARLALSEMAQSHIPASVTLAQGILETNAGDSYIARKANNHFGIKCYKYKDYKADGRIDDNDFYHHDLAYGCVQIKDDHVWDRFQMYPSVAASYRHHSLLLTREPRYNWMIAQYGNKIGETVQVESHWFGTDTAPYYAAWCIGLKKSGYATGKRYAQKLAYIIETYELWRFDYQLVMS